MSFHPATPSPMLMMLMMSMQCMMMLKYITMQRSVPECSGCSPPFHPGATPAAAPSSRQGVVPTSIMSALVTLSLIIIILEVYLLAKGPSGPRFLLDIVPKSTRADDQDLHVHVHVHVQLPIHQWWMYPWCLYSCDVYVICIIICITTKAGFCCFCIDSQLKTCKT